jgi:hypothetical protein
MVEQAKQELEQDGYYKEGTIREILRNTDRGAVLETPYARYEFTVATN